MKLSLAAYLAIALALSLAGNAVQLYLAGGQKPKCELQQAEAVIDATVAQRKDEGARDQKLDAVTHETKADTAKGVAKVEKQTHERAAAIAAVPAPAAGTCLAPVGLPSLDAAVDEANAAAGF